MNDVLIEALNDIAKSFIGQKIKDLEQNFHGQDKMSPKIFEYLKEKFPNKYFRQNSSQQPFDIWCFDDKAAIEIKTISSNQSMILSNATIYPNRIRPLHPDLNNNNQYCLTDNDRREIGKKYKLDEYFDVLIFVIRTKNGIVQETFMFQTENTEKQFLAGKELYQKANEFINNHIINSPELQNDKTLKLQVRNLFHFANPRSKKWHKNLSQTILFKN